MKSQLERTYELLHKHGWKHGRNYRVVQEPGELNQVNRFEAWWKGGRVLLLQVWAKENKLGHLVEATSFMSDDNPTWDEWEKRLQDEPTKKGTQ